MFFHQAGLVFFLTVLLGISLSNLFAMRRLESSAGRTRLLLSGRFPCVSILLPARNEDRNIELCVRSLLAQQYPDFEVLVLNDHSTDRTGQILSELALEDGRLRVFSGKPLPPGWLGKHWACHQLSQAARGELLLFTDADTRHTPRSLQDAVSVMLAKEVVFLSAWPRQLVHTWGERLIVPLIYWSLQSFLPLALIARIHLPFLSAAIGQFMLFRRQAYRQVGGHAAVRDNAADDMALARRINAEHLPWCLLDAGQSVQCRMYNGFFESLHGLSKTLLGAFDYRILPFVFIWSWLGIVFLEPPVLIISGILGWELPGFSPLLASISILQAILLWGIAYWRFHFPLWLTFLYPVSIFFALWIAGRSLLFNLFGKASWKDRAIPRPAIHWW